MCYNKAMKRYNLVLAGALFCLLSFFLGFSKASFVRAAVTSSCSGLNCDDGVACTKDETSPFSITLPNGSAISKVWIKASTSCFSFTADGNDGCYSVSGIGTQTVNVEKIGVGTSCPDISHIEAIVTPTAVRLVSFSARCRSNFVLVRWRTALEVNTCGYNIWRSTSKKGPFTKINSEIIPPTFGSPSGGNYSLKDHSFVSGVKYFYRLEEIECNGWSNFYSRLAPAKCGR